MDPFKLMGVSPSDRLLIGPDESNVLFALFMVNDEGRLVNRGIHEDTTGFEGEALRECEFLEKAQKETLEVGRSLAPHAEPMRGP